jgi:SAM-dependent methyltransferase
MHPTSLENMRKCHGRFFLPSSLAYRPRVRVLDIGGADVNGSYRTVYAGPPFDYRTADLSPGPGVDLVLTDPYRIPLPDGSIDIVLSGQMLEHSEFFWLAFREMVRLLSPEGFLFLIAPSSGPIHRYPVDCYRFYPDAYAALAKYTGCHLQAVWRDERGPWQDLVGVFRKTEAAALAPPRAVTSSPAVAAEPIDSRPEEEVTAGRAEYLEVLRLAHERLAPRLYLEIGVRHGRSLALATGRAIGVDPAPEVREALGAATRVVTATSDDFFDEQAEGLIDAPVDLAFIDGMHWFEHALRDWMQVERRAAPAGLVLVDDIYPNHPRQSLRERATRVWTGDVWKLYACLAALRPDLLLLPLDSHPTGLLLIAGLDPGNRVLWERYNPVVKEYRDRLAAEPPAEVIARRGALSPDDPLVGELLGLLRRLRDAGAGVAEVRAALAHLRARLAGPPDGVPLQVGLQPEPEAADR